MPCDQVLLADAEEAGDQVVERDPAGSDSAKNPVRAGMNRSAGDCAGASERRSAILCCQMAAATTRAARTKKGIACHTDSWGDSALVARSIPPDSMRPPADGSTVALAAFAFIAVVREGLETALLLMSATATAGGAVIATGTVLGLASATALGTLVYRGSKRVSTRRFFQFTGAVVILFAAGLVAKTIVFLQAAGDLSSINEAVYDLTRYRALTLATQTGRFLTGIFGWDPRPSFES